MRTTKRFTPTVLARFVREGRGTGTYSDYTPWHKVSRGDPASSGRSHLLKWRGRLRDLLSDGELGQQLFAVMLPDLGDCLEQFGMSLEPSSHLLSRYGLAPPDRLFPGTHQIAKEMGIKHPRLVQAGVQTSWVLTTDLVLIFVPPKQPVRVVALAFKPDGALLSPRKRALLMLEREFWVRRKVQWLLITPALYDLKVRLTLQRTACWALASEVPQTLRDAAVQTARTRPWASLTTILTDIAADTGSLELAQDALWQAVWRGDLPIDLRRGWRPHVPLLSVSTSEFWGFNPIASGRSSWT